MIDIMFTPAYVVGVLLLSLVLFSLKPSRNSWKLPPGPKGWPLIGNIYDVPRVASWRAFQQWGKRYGNVIYFHTFGKPVVVLNSVSAAHDLLAKRSGIYSYRPQFAMANEVIGWKFSLPSMDYGEKSKRQRKYLQSYFHKQRLPRYYPIQLKEVHRLLNDLVDDPENYRTHIKRMVGGITMMLTYGHEVKTIHDPFIAIVEKGADTIKAVGVIGVHIVDLLPWLRFIPDWCPGASIKSLPPGTREDLQAFLHTPFNQVKRQMADGTAVACYTTTLLEETRGQDEEGVLGTAAIIYSGGFDTTMAALMTAFTMLVANPAIQTRAQAEMDIIVGKDRLPTFSDRERMPYMHCIVSETLRWGAVTPVGVPHRLVKDDFYNGFYLPAGSMIMANQWGMLHDPEVYENPSKFDPDRFLQREGHAPEPDPRDIAFGFGRRICPGADIAENTLWAAIVLIFFAFRITPAHDPAGKEIPIDLEYDEGTVRHLKPFKCTIEPRQSNSVSLIRQTVDGG
ncbi:cytochrome P450 [Mycena galopus ATCC 62051]|nr:cytochrome P450 [Mycena galopus ATCC 62051]